MFMASMTFDLGEEVNALRDMVHRWAQERVKPLAAEVDRTNAFPNELWPKWGSWGFWGSPWTRPMAGRAWGTWPIPSRSRRSAASRPPSG
jgi:isovaleryl-CoA dehydrogenase